jgi:hypothetical protein
MLSIEGRRDLNGVTLQQTSPPVFRFCARSSFCREFTLSHAPETRVNQGPGFLSINKMFHFIER